MDTKTINCPNCGSEKVALTSGNAVGNTHDCLTCLTDFTPDNHEDIAYLLAIVSTHADKFPVPEHVLSLVARVRKRVEELEEYEFRYQSVSK
jgi:hypothetical protein